MLILDVKSKINVKLNKPCHLRGNVLQGFKGTAFLVDKQEHAQAFRGFSRLIKSSLEVQTQPLPQSLKYVLHHHMASRSLMDLSDGSSHISVHLCQKTAGVFRECGDVNTSVAHSKPFLPFWFVLIEAEEICYAV